MGLGLRVEGVQAYHTVVRLVNWGLSNMVST